MSDAFQNFFGVKIFTLNFGNVLVEQAHLSMSIFLMRQMTDNQNCEPSFKKLERKSCEWRLRWLKLRKNCEGKFEVQVINNCEESKIEKHVRRKIVSLWPQFVLRNSFPICSIPLFNSTRISSPILFLAFYSFNDIWGKNLFSSYENHPFYG